MSKDRLSFQNANQRIAPFGQNAGARRWLQARIYAWEQPLSSALFATIIYTAFALPYGSLWQTSGMPYFNHLADAFLHGQLHLRVLPPSTHDLSFYEGRYYLYWPPFPALLLVPFVALFGVGFSDIIFTLLIAGFNVALVALLLRRACERGVVDLSQLQRGLLVLFFALGTVHLTLAPLGRVWFTGQLIGFACVGLAYLAALSLHGAKAFALAGLAIACAFLTRNHLVLAGLWPAIYLLYRHWEANWKRLVSYTLTGLIPVIGAVGLLAMYNWLRFGHPLDNGLDYHQMASRFVEDYQRYGAFSTHYLPTNLFYQYIAYPFPIDENSVMGGSLFLLSPVFFAAFWGLFFGRPRWSMWTLAATILLIATPILLLMGTGWIQWGPRYTLDFTIPLLLLTAAGIRRWPNWVLMLLLTISVIHYVIGTLHLSTRIA
jgi:hypothetical protein